MRFLSESATQKWLSNSDFSIDENGRIHYREDRTFSIALELPLPSYSYSNYCDALLPYDIDNPTMPECLLYVRDWGKWNEHHERAAMYIFEQLRKANGEYKPVRETPSQVFSGTEITELQSFLIVPVLFHWNAYLVPQDGRYLVFVSHDEFVWIDCKSQEQHQSLMQHLKTWQPVDRTGR